VVGRLIQQHDLGTVQHRARCMAKKGTQQ
jgi:hypothetical protein